MKKLLSIFVALTHCLVCACTASAGEAEALRSELFELKAMMQKVSDRVVQIESRIQVLEGGEPSSTSVTDLVEQGERPVPQQFRSGPKLGTSYAKKGWLLNPDISLISNMNYFFQDGDETDFGEFGNEELNVQEIELDLASYIYPGIKAWSTIAYEPEEDEVGIEEAFVHFETLPYNASATLGRRFIDFGLVNPIHQHFRPYTDSPLVFSQLFGEAFVDDGFLASILLPTPGDLSAQLKAGIYDGRKELVEEHGEEEEVTTSVISGPMMAEAMEEAGLEFGNHILHLGADLNHPLGEDADITLGYDVLLDDFEGDDLAIQSASAVLRYYVPESEQKLLWQNEIYAVTGDEIEEPLGFYSFLRYSINRYLDVGVRYDWTELLGDDSEEAWAVVPSVTWNITESTYARAQYRHIDVDGIGEANEFWLQFVFGFGPHSHGVNF